MATATRSILDSKLKSLQDGVVLLSELVESQLLEAEKALQARDVNRARRVAEFDRSINEERYRLEEEAYTLMALQSPTTRDLRALVSVVSIVTNLERMADHAAGIARLVLRMEGQTTQVHLPALHEMVELSVVALRQAMLAFTRWDSDAVAMNDAIEERIDALHQRCYDQLIATMTADASSIENCTMLLWISHNIERFADRVSNICDRITFVATGDLCRSRVEMTA